MKTSLTRREMLLKGASSLALAFAGCTTSRRFAGLFSSAVAGEIRRQIAEGTILGAAVGTTDGSSFDATCGGASGLSPKSLPVDALTRFDLASLTKTLVAATGARLVADGRLDPDAPFTEYFTEHALGRNCAITVLDLATHGSGFANFPGSFYSEDPAVHGGAAAFEHTLRTLMPKAKRGTYRYSCYNYALLGTVIERAGGERLDRLAERLVFRPLGMRSTCWWPLVGDAHVVAVPLKMRDGKLRRPGEVHDEVARHAGRPIGNAGVFSTLPDMLRFVGDLLNRQAFQREYYDLLFTPTLSVGDDARSFGFDMGANGRPDWVSPASIRHTGFTGQLLCVDPVVGFAGVALTLRLEGKPSLSARWRLLASP